jgi:hypothetical protein
MPTPSLTARACSSGSTTSSRPCGWGVDPDVSREVLAALVESSTMELDRDEHREIHAGDFARWGRRGGLATIRRYGTAWFSLLARRRWEKISGDALAEAFAAINGRRP